MDKISFFILNIFLNSFLAFYTAVFLIECIIFLFRLSQGRTVATLRMIPIIKLPLDLFLYDFSSWSYAQGINPLDCEQGTRTLSAVCGGMSYVNDWLLLPINSSIQLTVPGHLTFTIADIIGYSIDPLILKIFAGTFICLSAGFMIRNCIQCAGSLKTLDFLAKGSKSLSRKMRNPILASYIKKSRVQILTSQTLMGSPFVAGLISSAIYVPIDLSKSLSRREFEAVISHEIEHVRYKDNLVRLILDFIGSAFWWIPTRWLRHRIEESQEISCDLKCHSYGIDSTVLASAVCKSVKYSVHNTNPIFVHHLTKHAISKRINTLLKPASNRFKKISFTMACLAVGIGFFEVLLGRFWMF